MNKYLTTKINQIARHLRSILAPLLSAIALVGASAPSPTNAPQPGRQDILFRKAFDAAVSNGLVYLARAQKPDGAFGQPHAAVASLCVMAFLAHGDTPGRGIHGETLNRGIDYVIGCQGADGAIVGPGGNGMYSHCISTLMLAEVSGMVNPERQARIDKALGNALRVILTAQQVKKAEPMRGGWRYAPNSTDSDISLSGWATMALWAARNCGAAVPKEAMEDAAGFILRCRAADGGFAYQPGGGSGMARTGIALLCLEVTGRHNDEITRSAGEWILKRAKSKTWSGEYFYYGAFYTAQGMHRLGGPMWDEFAPLLYDRILKRQSSDGSWPDAPGFTAESAGPCYRTAMALLALSVSYGQLPTYQK